MSTELAVIEVPEFLPVLKQSSLAKAEAYGITFAPFMMTVKELSGKATGINHDNPSGTDAALAKTIRLAMVKNRTATEKKKDEEKAGLLAEGKLIQALYNVVESTSQMVEVDLAAIEKFAENKEKARVEALRVERAAQLADVVEDTSIYPLGEMAEHQFVDLLNGLKLAKEAREKAAADALAAKLKAEADAREEQERIRKENAELKDAAEAKEKARLAELAKIEAANKAAREKAAKLAAEAQAKAEALRKAAEDKLAAERKTMQAEAEKKAVELKKAQDTAAALQAQGKARKDAELKVAADKAAAEKKAAKAPDKDKILAAIKALPTFAVLDLKTTEAAAIADTIRDKYAAFKKWAAYHAASL